MPAPSKSWVTIADSQVDADSPLDAVLMTGVRDDLVHLQEWLGYGYTAAQAHTHNGTDSALVTAIGADTVTEAMIKWASAGGISQFVLTTMLSDAMAPAGTLTAVTWLTGKTLTCMIDVPANANSLEYHAYAYGGDGSNYFGVALVSGATNGTTAGNIANNATAPNWSGTAGAIDVSAMSGWTEFTIKYKNLLGNGGTLNLCTVVGRFK